MKFILEFMVCILSITLLLNLIILAFLNSNFLDLHYEEELGAFYEKHIAYNTDFPLEYRDGIDGIPRVIKLIKDNPEKYSNIPKEYVTYIDYHVRLTTERDDIKAKMKKIAIFVGLTLVLYLSSLQSFLNFYQPLFFN